MLIFNTYYLFLCILWTYNQGKEARSLYLLLSSFLFSWLYSPAWWRTKQGRLHWAGAVNIPAVNIYVTLRKSNIVSEDSGSPLALLSTEESLKLNQKHRVLLSCWPSPCVSSCVSGPTVVTRMLLYTQRRFFPFIFCFVKLLFCLYCVCLPARKPCRLMRYCDYGGRG